MQIKNYLFSLLLISLGIISGCYYNSFTETISQNISNENGKIFLKDKFIIRNTDLDIKQLKKNKVLEIPFYASKEKNYRIQKSKFNKGNYNLLCMKLKGQLLMAPDEGYDYYLIVKYGTDSITTLSNFNTILMHNSVWKKFVFDNVQGKLIINNRSEDEISSTINITASGYKNYYFGNNINKNLSDSIYSVHIWGSFEASEYKLE